MAKPGALILTGYGINCDNETQYALGLAGANARRVHVNDLISSPRQLRENQILGIPGGFSYGDDTGAGKALANKLEDNLGDVLREFIGKDNLVIGICNGFQVLVNQGLLPAFDGKYGERKVALTHNDSARYFDRWVDLQFQGESPWVNGLKKMSLPIAHGEGSFYADPETLARLNARGLVAARYVNGEICESQNLPANPNGSLEDIAAITDESGRVLGMMPHPERAIDFTHLPNWTLLREQYKRAGKEMPEEADGLKIFRNGVKYFK